MDLENLDQIKEKIQQEMSNALNNSKLGDIFDSYGITGDHSIQFQCILDLTKVQFKETAENNQLQNFLKAIPGQQLVVQNCCNRPGCLCCNC